jgi:membrane-bound lytic murein transglycosylase
MKFKLSYFLFLFVLLASCKDNNQKRDAENEKDAKKKELIFSNINKGWVFYDTPINETAEASVGTWTELRLFIAELAQKPKKTIGAFQQKSTAISKKALALKTNIPLQFDVPQIKSRISVLITKVRMLDLYIHLDNIPDDKVVVSITEINKELASLQRQMDNIVEKSKIPVEQGESELIKMMDPSRAIPSEPLIDPNTPRVE